MELLTPAEATPTALALREEMEKLHAADQMDEYADELAHLLLAYDDNRRQIRMLLWAHGPLVLLIFLLAVAGNHHHVINMVALVYVWLFLAFACAVLVLGLSTRLAWVPRFFGTAMFMMAAGSVVVVAYAVATQINMQMWYDVLLLALQVLDLAITLVYIWSADQMAGAGGLASALMYKIDASGLAVSPLASHTRTEAAINAQVLRGTWQTRLVAWLKQLMQPRVGHAHQE